MGAKYIISKNMQRIDHTAYAPSILCNRIRFMRHHEKMARFLDNFNGKFQDYAGISTRKNTSCISDLHPFFSKKLFQLFFAYMSSFFQWHNGMQNFVTSGICIDE